MNRVRAVAEVPPGRLEKWFFAFKLNFILPMATGEDSERSWSTVQLRLGGYVLEIKGGSRLKRPDDEITRTYR